MFSIFHVQYDDDGFICDAAENKFSTRAEAEAFWRGLNHAVNIDATDNGKIMDGWLTDNANKMRGVK
jgi:hypothetical protein